MYFLDRLNHHHQFLCMKHEFFNKSSAVYNLDIQNTKVDIKI